MVNRCIAGLLLLLLLLIGSAAQANEADDTIRRLVADARADAVARGQTGLAKTLFEIAEALPGASEDGIAAVNELSKYLADLAAAAPKQDATAPPAPPSAAPPLQPVESPPAQPDPPTREAGAEAQQPPPAPMPPAPPVPALALAPALPAPASPATAAPRASAALLDMLRRQGAAALGNGDISGARRFYQRGAEAGCAPCAEAMAQTFDAGQLNRMGAIGIKPDPAQAEVWRARARQLAPAGTP